MNDNAACDLQLRGIQLYEGKSFRTSGPVGPHPALLDGADPGVLQPLRLTLTELSRVRDFDADDLRSTGTRRLGPVRAVALEAANRAAPARAGEVEAVPGDAVEAHPVARARGRRRSAHRSIDGGIDLGVQRNQIVREE